MRLSGSVVLAFASSVGSGSTTLGFRPRFLFACRLFFCPPLLHALLDSLGCCFSLPLQTFLGLDSQKTGQRYLDGWTLTYNLFRGHESLGNKTPGSQAKVAPPFREWAAVVKAGAASPRGTRPGNSKSGIEVLKGGTSLGRGSMIIDSNVIGGNGKHGIWYHGPRDEWHGGLDFASRNAIGVTNCELHPNKFVFGPPTAIPNALDGIYISHEANHIMIEENCIWFNGRDGVRVDGQDAVKNWIPNNSIHGNQGKGIENINGGNTELPPPQIIAGPNGPNGSFGDVVGTTCSNCLIELFSDSGGEGRTPLGEVAADSGGVFSFSGLVAIIPGDKITGTATGERQNTSEFGCDIVAPSVDLSVTKTDTILEGPELTSGGSIEYTVRITNNSSDPVPDMPRNEFEDAIPLAARPRNSTGEVSRV